MTNKLHFLVKGLLSLTFLLCSYITFAQPPCQSITVQMVSTNPLGTGGDGNPIKICQGSTVTFTASATFGTSSAGALYIWTYGDETLPDTTNTLTVSHTYNDGGVFVVDMLVVDPQGCKNTNRLEQVVQVSTTPIFAGTQANVDTICLHYTAQIHGEAEATPGIYDCAPPIADTTFLPDGTGVSYETSIEVGCFAFGSTLTNVNQLQSICINMEHSFIGDLIVSIECPNGQSTLLFDGNTAGSGGTYLGGAIDNTTPNTPGIGFDYCFSTTATWGTLPAENAALNFVQAGVPLSNAMPAGTYQPQGSFNNLLGCPLNGDWTITVTDDQGADDGYIFGWEINFDPALLPGSYSFLPTFVNQGFIPSPDIIATTNGGHDITVKPGSGGQKCYTYKVTDNFGCSYDTTVCIYVMDPGNPGADTAFKLCLNQGTINAFDHLGGNPTLGGVWSGTGVSAAGIFDPAVAGVGIHDIVYSQSIWNCDTNATLSINVVNDVIMDFSFKLNPACDQDTVLFTNLSEPGQYWWNFADGTSPDDTTTNPIHIYQQQNIYPVRLTVRNMDGCIDSVLKMVDIRHPLIAAFNRSDDSICQTDSEPIQFTDVSTGSIVGWNWDFGDGTPISTLQNPTHHYNLAGVHQVRLIINDNIPCYDTIYHTVYVDSLPFLELNPDRYAICVGEQLNLSLDYLKPALRVNWVFGDGTYWSDANGNGETAHSFDMPGTFWVSVKVDYPVCAPTTATDSVVVKAFPVVNLGPDSVLCLDGPSVLLTDLNNANNPAMSFLWNTGETTPSINATHPGIYSVTVSEQDCATTDNIVINKDCYTDIPNAFTPNGDGDNDYFYPRQLLAKGVTSFTMTVFNRWGQKVFETSNPNGRGWDGRFNDKEQPMGVYVYQIKVVMKNGKAEEYTGNVTMVK